MLVKKGAVMNDCRILCIVGILLLLPIIRFILLREKCKRKILRMDREEKIKKLSFLAKPFGFSYDGAQDVFVSRVDAWQRKEGYEALFDQLASKFHMILHDYPVYFDYQGKTWLIEFWKGQYGIHAGGEAGVYHANRLIPKEQQKLIHYNAVSDEEMPLIGLCIEKNGNKIFSKKEHHWWMAAFQTGTFSQPKDITLYASLTFHNSEAAKAFFEGLKAAGYPKESRRIQRNRVSVTFGRQEGSLWEGQNQSGKRYRNMAQHWNRFYCRMYLFLTRPFTDTPDRLLFLYEQLPGCLKRLLSLRSFGRKARVKK